MYVVRMISNRSGIIKLDTNKIPYRQ